MKNFKSWILAARPKTLTAALVPILVGTALSQAESMSFSIWVSGLAFLAALFIQIGTNLINDAMDFKKGADTADRLGPQRVTQAGIFKTQQVLAVGSGFFLLALICGIPLVVQGGWPILIVGLVSVIMGYAYTAGPYPLAYRGLGDVFVILFFGLIATGGIFYLHQRNISLNVLVAGLQVGFLCAVLIAINNLRDIEGDRLVHKKTLPVRFGKSFARWEIAFLSLSPFLIGIYWWTQNRFWAFLLPLIVCPLAIQITKLVFLTEPSPAYNNYLVRSATLHLVFGLLLSVGFLL